jgi:hypothetical protein
MQRVNLTMSAHGTSRAVHDDMIKALGFEAVTDSLIDGTFAEQERVALAAAKQLRTEDAAQRKAQADANLAQAIAKGDRRYFAADVGRVALVTEADILAAREMKRTEKRANAGRIAPVREETRDPHTGEVTEIFTVGT